MLLQFVVLIYKSQEKRFSFSCVMPWRCKRKPEREYEHIMYNSYRFNCKPHMWTHTNTAREFSKIYFKIQREKFLFFTMKNSLSRKSANTNTVVAGKFNIFNDDSPCVGHENSLALENVLMKKPCVFPLHVVSTLFMPKISSRTYVSSFDESQVASWRFLIRLSCIKILERHLSVFLIAWVSRGDS